MPYRTQPIAQGGIPAQFPSQIGEGEAQIFPRIPVPDLTGIAERKRKEREGLLKKPELPTGMIPAMRRAMQSEIDEYYNELKMLKPKELRQRKDEILERAGTWLGVARDSEVLYGETAKKQQQALIKGESRFENYENLNEITSDAFYSGKPLMEAQIAAEDKEKAVKAKRIPFDVPGYIATKGKSLIQMKTEANTVSWTDPDTNQVVTQTIKEFNETGAKQVANLMMEHPSLFGEVQYKYNGLPPEEQNQYTDINDYFAKEFIIPFTKEDIATRRTVPKEGEAAKKTPGAYTTKNFKWGKQKNTIEAKGNRHIISAESPLDKEGNLQVATFPDIVDKEIDEWILSKPKALTKGIGATEFSISTSEGERIVKITPYSVRKINNKFYLYGLESKSNENVHIPYNEVAQKMHDSFEGITTSLLEEIEIKELDTKKTEEKKGYTNTQQKAIDEAKKKQDGKISQNQIDWIIKNK